MSGNHQRATPSPDEIRHALSAVGADVRKATRSISITPKRTKKPTKDMKAFLAGSRNKVEDRKTFGKLLEVTFYGAGDRYTIRPIDRQFEIWDAETHDVYGPYPTHADAVIAVRAL